MTSNKELECPAPFITCLHVSAGHVASDAGYIPAWLKSPWQFRRVKPIGLKAISTRCILGYIPADRPVVSERPAR